MKEKVECNIKIYDNYIEITPLEGVKDNSYYEIEIDKIFSESRLDIVEDVLIGFNSKMYPYYTSSYAVYSLVGAYDIPEDVILFYIREHSRHVDYMLKRINISGWDPEDISFKASQYVKYASAYDCILRLFIDKATMGGIKGELADVKFDNNRGTDGLKDLLDRIGRKKKDWEDILQGYEDMGKAAPTSVLRGMRALPEIHPTPVSWPRSQYNSNLNNFVKKRFRASSYTGPMGNSAAKTIRKR